MRPCFVAERPPLIHGPPPATAAADEASSHSLLLTLRMEAQIRRAYVIDWQARSPSTTSSRRMADIGQDRNERPINHDRLNGSGSFIDLRRRLASTPSAGRDIMRGLKRMASVPRADPGAVCADARRPGGSAWPPPVRIQQMSMPSIAATACRIECAARVRKGVASARRLSRGRFMRIANPGVMVTSA